MAVECETIDDEVHLDSDDIRVLLPDEESLERVPEYLSQTDTKLHDLRHQIATKLDEIRILKEDNSPVLEFSQSTLLKQMERTREMRERVDEMEEALHGRLDQLQRLDLAKRNLEETMTLIKRIQMLQSGLDQIEKLLAQGKYSAISPLLLGLLQIASVLEPLIGTTRNLRSCLKRLEEMKIVLWNAIMALFQSHAGVKGGFRPNKTDAIILAQAVMVIQVLGGSYRKRLIDWYVENQLKGYKDLYRGNLEMASLEKLNNRFHWLQRLLSTFKDEHRIIFMDSWNVEVTLCAHFCATTAKDIVDMLKGSEGRLDPSSLLDRIREAQGFERGLMQLFPAADPASFKVSSAFEGHVGIFLQVQEKEFLAFLATLPAKLGPGDIDSGHLISSAPLFFVLIRDSLGDMLSLGSPSLIRDLFEIFNKHMVEYSKYLQKRLPKRLSMGKLLKQPDVKLVCTLISTASYCIETAQRLASEVGQLQETERGMASFEPAVQSLHVLASLSMAQIDMHTEMVLQSAWTDMATILKDSWNTKHQVGDQSPYITTTIQSGLEEILQQVRRYISKPSILQSLASKIVMMVVERFKETIFECKPISPTGAQQLIVDMAGLRKILADHLRTRRRSNSDEEEALQKELAMIEGIIKVILLPVDPASTFVEGYLLLVGDPSQSTFHKIIQLKSLSKPELASITEQYSKIVPEAPSGTLQTGKKFGQHTTRRPVMSTTDQVINRFKYFDIEEQVLKKLPLALPSSLLGGNKDRPTTNPS